MIISQNFRLDETINDCRKYKEELNIKTKDYQELEREKKELESKLEINRDVIELIGKVDELSDKEFNFRETVNDFLKKADGARSLTAFIYVLNQKIKNYEEEIVNCNNKIFISYSNYSKAKEDAS
jgi:predicted  nucleic acid-binding Zn-ribbon protein